VLSLTSAALHHGWEVKHTPERPHVTVPRRRRVDPSLAARVVMHYSDLMRDEITDGRRYNLMVVHGWLAPLACPATRRTFAAPGPRAVTLTRRRTPGASPCRSAESAMTRASSSGRARRD